MEFQGISQDLGICGRLFESPARIARFVYRRRGWWPEFERDDVGQIWLACYVVGDRIYWRGMARFKMAAWRGDRALIARKL